MTDPLRFERDRIQLTLLLVASNRNALFDAAVFLLRQRLAS